MKETLTHLAKSFDSRLKMDDPDYLLEIQAREAIKKIVSEHEENSEEVNIAKVLNILYEAPSKEDIYEIVLSAVSKQILKLRGVD